MLLVFDWCGLGTLTIVGCPLASQTLTIAANIRIENV